MKPTARELERRSFGSCERMEHQVMWELRYSGFLEELAQLTPRQRERRFDEVWEGLTNLIRFQALRAADELRWERDLEASQTTAEGTA